MPSIGPDQTPQTSPHGTSLHITVGIIVGDGKVFISRRPDDAHQGGKWEFPGGKVRPEETVFEALFRELREELGIEVRAAAPFIKVCHAYADRTVLLDAWRVTAHSGSPRGREGQEVRWVAPDELNILDFPEANRPILRKLQLPLLYLITDSRRFGTSLHISWADFLMRLERALRAGARLVQLREPHLSESDYQVCAKETTALCHRYGAKLLLNADPGLVGACGADGVHLNRQRLMNLRQRPLGPELLVAASCHDAGELKQAVHLDVDFAVLSPVARTLSHPDVEPLGWETFRDLCAEAAMPVYALGGMRPQDLPRARAAGAQGLAMISGIWQEDAIEEAMAALMKD